jgi:hypothetical protein
MRQALEVAGIVFSVGDNGTTAMVSGPLRLAPVAPTKMKPPGRTSRPGGRKCKSKARAF